MMKPKLTEATNTNMKLTGKNDTKRKDTNMQLKLKDI
jgi:hypothetical protein